MNDLLRCPECGGEEFFATATVTLIVGNNMNIISTRTATEGPPDDIVWALGITCTGCGHHAQPHEYL